MTPTMVAGSQGPLTFLEARRGLTAPARGADLPPLLAPPRKGGPVRLFALASLFASGCPVAGSSLGAVAEAILAAALRPKPREAKVLVTDLDNSLWAGIVGEDGEDGIAWSPEGRGFRHFVYQTFLARLRR